MEQQNSGGALSSKHSRLVSIEDLRLLPSPAPMGTRHKPIAHAALVDGIITEATSRGYTITKQQLALSSNGARLFGVLDMGQATLVREEIRGLSFGFRNAVDQTMAIQAVAGTRVFVCDNLALSGDMIALFRKNTTGIDLASVLAAGFDKFLQHAGQLDRQIARLQAKAISDLEAKAMVFDVFAAGIMPVRLFDSVEGYYFRPADDMVDCQPRTAWGLHNACTRAIKVLDPVPAFRSTVALGKHFGIRSGELDAAIEIV